MLIALILLGQFDWTAAPGKPEVAVADTRPQCIIVSSRGCPPCVRLKARLQPIAKRADIRFQVIDIRDWNAKNPHLLVTATPELFLYRTPGQRGQRYDGAKAAQLSVDSIVAYLIGSGQRAALRYPPPQGPPAVVAHVGVGDFDGDGIDGTESDYRIHLRQHGIDPSGMSMEQMIAAHDAAHERGQPQAQPSYSVGPVRRLFGGLRRR
ncbi:MAG: glutaredoxin family protein [Planctomycetales bacterium]|nr:glutaredoxin family protein [Planctomycetales bacterium]